MLVSFKSWAQNKFNFKINLILSIKEIDTDKEGKGESFRSALLILEL